MSEELKHITRYDKKEGAYGFSGYRLTRSSGFYRLDCHFSDLKYGSKDKSKEAAVSLNNKITEKFKEIDSNADLTHTEKKRKKADFLMDLRIEIIERKKKTPTPTAKNDA